MHAIAQSEVDAAQYGRLRYSLWTGDPGLAIYLWDCIQRTATFPSLDIFFTEVAKQRLAQAPQLTRSR